MFWAIIVLPKPCEATRTRLRPAARKSRRRAASTAGRSMRVGQAQSKSVIGLNRPIRARASRRSRLRRGRSCCSVATRCSSSWMGLQRRLVARATRSSRWVAVWCQPRALRASFNEAIGLLLGGRRVKQRVVRAEAVGRDVEVADARIIGQDDSKRGRGVARSRALVEQMSDGGGMDRAAREGVGEGRLKRRRSVLIEQAEEGQGLRRERLPAPGQRFEKRVRLRATLAETVAPAELMRAAFLADQGRQVGGILEAPTVIPAARVMGDR